MRKKTWIIGGVLITTVLIGGAVAFSQQAPLATVVTDTVKRGTLVQTVDATGTVKTLEHVDLSFNAAGSVEVLNVRVGDIVRVGDVLASLISTDAYAELMRAQALLAQKQAGATVEEVRVAEETVLAAQAALAGAQSDAADALTQLTAVEDATVASVSAAKSSLTTTIASTALARSQAFDDTLVTLSK